MTDNGINAQALCIIEFDVIRNGIIENIKVTSNCDFCNTAVEEAVKLSSRYWILKPICRHKRVKVSYRYKYLVR